MTIHIFRNKTDVFLSTLRHGPRLLRKMLSCAYAGNAGNYYFEGKRGLNDPDMHHDTCMTAILEEGHARNENFVCIFKSMVWKMCGFFHLNLIEIYS